MVKIKRALVSVSDKTGLMEFVRELAKMGVEILSTGGTAKLLEKEGIRVRGVAEFTGSPEMLDGRVKTLHPRVHGALLARREDPEHMRQVKEQGIELIDLVVVNLYPFEQTIAKKDVTREEAIENIDIGGPSMLRSAAKNFSSVAVVGNPARYPEILKELKENQGGLSDRTRLALAKEVFALTSGYDRMINDYLAQEAAKDGVPAAAGSEFPPEVSFRFEKIQELRYGENPHQKAAFYREARAAATGIAGARQLHGKELSYNNIIDLDSAWAVVREFDGPAVAIVKHNNPCGAATAKTLADAYTDALAGDPVSAFGGIIGLNRKVDAETAKRISGGGFVECIVAPGYDAKALEILQAKKNVRILEMPAEKEGASPGRDLRKVSGGALMQEKDSRSARKQDLKTVTSVKPDEKEIDSLLFAEKIAKHVKSNAIVLVQGTKTVGIGAGQMSRVDSVIIASRKAGERARGSVMASDAFFPKPDGIEAAATAGVKAIIQPGGSIQDEEAIAACEKAGIAMVFSGLRHFRH